MELFNISKYRDSEQDWEAYKEKSWFIGHSPWRIYTIQIIYLTFVLYLGPLFMRNRKPFELRWTMRAYNLFNLLFNLYNVKLQCDLTSNIRDYLSCNALQLPKTRYENWPGELLIISRLIDLLDTVFFVLRKKDKQINFLHVYHHATVPITVWYGAYMSMRHYCSSLLHMNSFVHVIMYAYYFLASFPSLAPYLWWKKYITLIQIAQFTIFFLYLAISYPLMTRYCEQPFPYGAYCINMATTLTFLMLFVIYYRSTYKRVELKKKLRRKQESIGQQKCNSVKDA